MLFIMKLTLTRLFHLDLHYDLWSMHDQHKCKYHHTSGSLLHLQFICNSYQPSWLELRPKLSHMIKFYLFIKIHKLWHCYIFSCIVGLQLPHCLLLQPASCLDMQKLLSFNCLSTCTNKVRCEPRKNNTLVWWRWCYRSIALTRWTSISNVFQV